MDLIRRLAQKMFWVRVVAGVDPVVQLLVNCDNDVERSLLNHRRVFGALQEVHLRKDQHLGASDEGIEFVLVKVNFFFKIKFLAEIRRKHSPCTS